MHRFGFSAHPQVTAAGAALFELKSWLGRTFYRARAPTYPYLNIGCGEHIMPGFENMDFYCFRGRARARRIVGHDLRFPMPYADESFTGAYSEHCLEHLYPHQALQFLTEVRRILRPGGVFRCVVPDLEKYVRYYMGDCVAPEFGQFRSGCEAIWSLTQDWGHLSVWDSNMLTEKLREVGFAEASATRFAEGRQAPLLIDTPARRWESLYVEAVR
jgi:SAM-dependent methyltransferase